MWAVRKNISRPIARPIRRIPNPNPSLSTSSRKPPHPYPYPSHPNPTPHQIFHLPPRASQHDVKTRYYDLVRIYHPDSPIVRSLGLPPEIAHARFQSISAAYGLLRGKKPTDLSDGKEDLFTAKTRWTMQDRARQRRAELHMGWDDRWKDRVIMGAVIVTVCLCVVQVTSTHRQAIAELSRSGKATAQQAGSNDSTKAPRPMKEDRLAALDSGDSTA